MSDLEPRGKLAGTGTKGVLALGGGVALMVLASSSVFGIVAGALLAVVGLVLVGSRQDRLAAGAAIGIGAAALATGLLSRWVPGIGWLMRAAGIVSICFGAYWLVRFVQGLRKRM